MVEPRRGMSLISGKKSLKADQVVFYHHSKENDVIVAQMKMPSISDYHHLDWQSEKTPFPHQKSGIRTVGTFTRRWSLSPCVEAALKNGRGNERRISERRFVLQMNAANNYRSIIFLLTIDMCLQKCFSFLFRYMRLVT